MPLRSVMTRLVGADDDGAVDDACAVIVAGGLVALPTETVYGLAALGLDDDAVRAIYAAKGRPADNPVILHVGDVDDAWPLWLLSTDERRRAERLIAAFWPGPLTIVAPASPVVPSVPRAGLRKVAVRLPRHPFARAVAQKLGQPFAAPSANLSGRPSPTTALDVMETLRGRIDLVVDGGACQAGIESSVVDVCGPRPRLLRPGALSVLELRKVLPDLDVRAPGLSAHRPAAGTSNSDDDDDDDNSDDNSDDDDDDNNGDDSDDDDDAASPGLRHRHYAPNVPSSLSDDVGRCWNDDDTGVIVDDVTAARLLQRLGPRAGFLAVLPADPVGFARGLYAALYRAERAAPRRLVIQRVDDDDEGWAAVRDRLLRATS